MKVKWIPAVLFCLILAQVCVARSDTSIPPYHSRADFLMAPPGAMGFGLYGYDNPALLNYVEQPDLLFTWSDQSGSWDDCDRWGIFTGVPHLGFGLIHEENELGEVTDYRVAYSVGDRRVGMGLGYGWSTGCEEAFGRSGVLTLGSLVRPMRQVSLGVVGSLATEGDAKEGVVDLGVRPMGNEKVTLFADYALQNGEKFSEGRWSTGAVLEMLPGVRLAGRYFDTHGFSVGLNLSLGRIGMASQAHYDKDREHGYNTYAVRVGARDRNIVDRYFMRNKKYLELNLFGPVKYQRFRMFDKSNTLMSVITAIDMAKNDPTIGGIAINTSGMAMDREMAWEIREKLKGFKSAGKHVVLFSDGLDINTYHFASVADRIVMDPVGAMGFQGYAAGRMYLKGALEKIGLGFDEWRFFTYKSAYEALSRDSMSEGDREQLSAIVEDVYALAKTDICAARSITPEEFDRLVNEEMLILPEEAIAEGLVDTLGRWEEVKKMVKSLEGKDKPMVGPLALEMGKLPSDDYWGEMPAIAVVYALGECAMDSGIKARSLSKTIDGLAGNKSVKAVVFRADSPGGEADASDIVAEALKKCSDKKPVIVTQGRVAGSGGYWISMYGDKILAAPNTITGSIGVIGGWIYNKGLKEKLGLSTDLVKMGEHADLGFGISLPLFGRVPDRNLREDERTEMEMGIRHFYKVFVEKVASGRGKKFEEIEPIAQGRVWSGTDGKAIGLIDELGGLERAIEIAKAEAGIGPDDEVEIVELPRAPLFDTSMFVPKIIGVDTSGRGAEDNGMLEHLRFRLEHNGEVMPLMPMDQMEMLLEPE